MNKQKTHLSKKKYDKLRYLENTEEIKKKRREYYKLNREKELSREKKRYKENTKEKIKYQLDYNKRTNYNSRWKKTKNGKEWISEYQQRPKIKLRNRIRYRTRYKYGKLPKGYEYHHPKPYDEDKWIGVAKDEHKQ